MLSTPPAFILSQDQTLIKSFSRFRINWLILTINSEPETYVSVFAVFVKSYCKQFDFPHYSRILFLDCFDFRLCFVLSNSFHRELLRCSQWIFQGYFTVQLSKFFVRCLCDSFYILSKAFVFVNNFFIFLYCRFKRQPVYLITGDRLCQQLFLPIQKFFKNWLSHPMPSVVLTFLLYVPLHQRQLAYNSTAAGRSQHISGGFVEVGHLAVFTAIVWIVPIICAILIFVACGENLEYGKRHQLFVFPANNRSARKITGDAFTLWFRKFSLHNATSFNCVPHAHITIGYNILLRCACKTQSFTEPLAPEGASDFFIYIVIVIHKNISH